MTTARWSGWEAPIGNCSERSGWWVSTRSGLWILTCRHSAFRSGAVGCRVPSGKPKNTTSDTPSRSAAARCSAARRAPRSDPLISGSSLPRLPSVHTTYRTSVPSAARRATVPPKANSASSGCATMVIAIFGSSCSLITLPFMSLAFPGSSIPPRPAIMPGLRPPPRARAPGRRGWRWPRWAVRSWGRRWSCSPASGARGRGPGGPRP